MARSSELQRGKMRLGRLWAHMSCDELGEADGLHVATERAHFQLPVWTMQTPPQAQDQHGTLQGFRV